jgi:hypothetical protein
MTTCPTVSARMAVAVRQIRTIALSFRGARESLICFGHSARTPDCLTRRSAAGVRATRASRSVAADCWAAVQFSMIRSARVSTDAGIVRPRAFAVFKLITNSNLLGCSTGNSAGLAPFNILSTYIAARRH